MKALAIWIAALLLGALVPAVAFCAALRDLTFLHVAFAITLAHALVLGLPAALLFRAMRWRRPWPIATFRCWR